LLASRDGREVMRGELEDAVTDVAEARALGAALADQFLARGGHRLVASHA
jgi:hypothetical protein